MIIYPYRDHKIHYHETTNEWSVTMEGMEERFRSMLQAKQYINEIEDRPQDQGLIEGIRAYRLKRKKSLQW